MAELESTIEYALPLQHIFKKAFADVFAETEIPFEDVTQIHYEADGHDLLTVTWVGRDENGNFEILRNEEGIALEMVKKKALVQLVNVTKA